MQVPMLQLKFPSDHGISEVDSSGNVCGGPREIRYTQQRPVTDQETGKDFLEQRSRQGKEWQKTMVLAVLPLIPVRRLLVEGAQRE
jgi:hypothetical protein